MEKVLIYTSTEGIKEHTEMLNKMVPFTQQVYNDFKAIGVTVTLQDLKPLFHSVVNYHQNPSSMIEGFVRQYFVAKVGGQTFNGVPADVSSLIKIPDVSQVVSRIQHYGTLKGTNTYYSPELMEINNDVVSAKSDAIETIEARFTYYSENDRGAEVAQKLFDLSEQLNGLRDYFKIDRFSNLYLEPVHGLERYNNRYRPDLRFIREEERRYPNYVAEGN
ncbi:hypothetical protein [Sphingobacterium sp.]|uniref:hypothetical protein n=1 Tax=Sphingobacterium sp. TaxID=341027 RepID=UPI0028A19E99|nr:hypothetical protein [Sphingobacterium sp.]